MWRGYIGCLIFLVAAAFCSAQTDQSVNDFYKHQVVLGGPGGLAFPRQVGMNRLTPLAEQDTPYFFRWEPDDRFLLRSTTLTGRVDRRQCYSLDYRVIYHWSELLYRRRYTQSPVIVGLAGQVYGPVIYQREHGKVRRFEWDVGPVLLILPTERQNYYLKAWPVVGVHRDRLTTGIFVGVWWNR